MSAPLARSAAENAPDALKRSRSAHDLYVWLAGQADSDRRVRLTPAGIGRAYGHLSANRVAVLLRQLRGGKVDGRAFVGTVAPEHAWDGGPVLERVAFIVPLDGRGRRLELDPDGTPRKGLVRGFEIRPPGFPTPYRRFLRGGKQVTRTSRRYVEVAFAPPDGDAAAWAAARDVQRHPGRPQAPSKSDMPEIIRPPETGAASVAGGSFQRAKYTTVYREAAAGDLGEAADTAGGAGGEERLRFEPEGSASGKPPEAEPCRRSGKPPEPLRTLVAAGQQWPGMERQSAGDEVGAEEVAGDGACSGVGGSPQPLNARRPLVGTRPRVHPDPVVQSSVEIANVALTKNCFRRPDESRADLFHGGPDRTADPTQAGLPQLVLTLLGAGHSDEDVLRGLGAVLRGRAARRGRGAAQGPGPVPLGFAEVDGAVRASSAAPAPARDPGVIAYRLGRELREARTRRAEAAAAEAAAFEAATGEQDEPPF